MRSRLQKREWVVSWFVYRAECAPIGPLETEQIVDAILAGRLAPDAWIAPAGGSSWRSALSIPEIAKLIDGMPTCRRASGIETRTSFREVSEPPPATTMPTTTEEAATERTPQVRVRGPDGFPLPAPSSTPTPPTYVVGGGDTLESIGSDKRDPGSSRKAGGL